MKERVDQEQKNRPDESNVRAVDAVTTVERGGAARGAGPAGAS